MNKQPHYANCVRMYCMPKVSHVIHMYKLFVHYCRDGGHDSDHLTLPERYTQYAVV